MAPVPTTDTAGIVTTSNVTTGNTTHDHPLIFLQTIAAQGIGGTFAVLALIVTCHQVYTTFDTSHSLQSDLSYPKNKVTTGSAT